MKGLTGGETSPKRRRWRAFRLSYAYRVDEWLCNVRERLAVARADKHASISRSMHSSTHTWPARNSRSVLDTRREPRFYLGGIKAAQFARKRGLFIGPQRESRRRRLDVSVMVIART